MTGLARLIETGDIAGLRRRIFRAFDGDSANVNKVGLGLNATLVKRRCFDEVGQKYSTLLCSILLHMQLTLLTLLHSTKVGQIAHPRDMYMHGIYRDEFVPEMRICGHAWKEPLPRANDEDSDGPSFEAHSHGSRATWYGGLRCVRST